MILNTINDHKYYGSAKNFAKRKESHFRLLRQNNHGNRHLQFAFNLYGEKYFEFNIIEEVSLEDLLSFEQLYLDEHYGKIDCYNLHPTACSPLGYKHSEEVRLKFSLLRRGNRNFMFGKNHSYETKSKISSSRITNKLSSGQNNVKAKLNNLQVRGIKYMLKIGYKQSTIRKAYNVTRSLINHIANGYTWKDTE